MSKTEIETVDDANGNVEVRFKRGMVELQQNPERIYTPTFYLTMGQAEHLRDQLISLFELEK